GRRASMIRSGCAGIAKVGDYGYESFTTPPAGRRLLAVYGCLNINRFDAAGSQAGFSMAVLPLQSMDSKSGVDAGMEALDKLADLVEEVAAEKKRRRSNIALKRAIRIWRRGDHAGAAQWALRATEID